MASKKDKIDKIKNTNMVPSVFLIIIFHAIKGVIIWLYSNVNTF